MFNVLPIKGGVQSSKNLDTKESVKFRKFKHKGMPTAQKQKQKQEC